MKKRTSFVSNSSSSSFVVAFPKIPKSIKETKDIMFPDGLTFVEIYDETMDTDSVAETVFRDLQGQEANNFKKACQTVCGGWYDGRPDYNLDLEYGSEESNQHYWAHYWTCDRLGVKKTMNFFKKNKGKHILLFSYADDGGQCVLEHGEIFRNLPHMQISYH